MKNFEQAAEAASVETLAAFVAVRNPHEYPAGTCTAWMDSADRVCGRPADLLCARHLKTARRRAVQELERREQQRQAAAGRLNAQRPQLQAELATIERRLDAIDPLRSDARPDRAQVNLPLHTRLPSDRRIHELAKLHERRTTLRARLGLG